MPPQLLSPQKARFSPKTGSIFHPKNSNCFSNIHLKYQTENCFHWKAFFIHQNIPYFWWSQNSSVINAPFLTTWIVWPQVICCRQCNIPICNRVPQLHVSLLIDLGLWLLIWHLPSHEHNMEIQHEDVLLRLSLQPEHLPYATSRL